jgi:hypothetical protein
MANVMAMHGGASNQNKENLCIGDIIVVGPVIIITCSMTNSKAKV